MKTDLENIYKSKTDKELYEIFSDKNSKYEEEISFAKKELENRNFEFDKIEL